ncbi:MAG TPA: MogA/MoaB family molybdenum cofactor biosynthesis protein [Candidatus Scatomorpha intestinavium]|uniref:MogA/MoaB family molybdenum cofactor biosynthesis protein n=1 Tax=Candidatus Scatomorpha intestinavium TaxID=2840922 RepID=A0A9D0ZFT9_9FIRM|nr:MogA/MoaB family molybdenum cofactor biosynthesis protein [Candidatus Scatomorpha intestinavium]
MEYTAAVIRVEDDSVYDGGSEEVALALRDLLEKDGWEIISVSTVPSDFDRIKGEIVRCSYDLGSALVLTTGGTGCSRYDVTPEATEAVINRLVPGIPEAMRFANNVRTPLAALSRGIAGLRGSTLIVNLPGSSGGAVTSLSAVLPALKQGVESLRRRQSR